MTNFQLMFVAILLVVFSPSCALAIYWLFPQQRYVSQNRQVIGACLLILATSTMITIITIIVSSQPVCVGMGDPDYIICQGVSSPVLIDNATKTNSIKLAKDLILYAVFPSLIGVSLVTWFLRHARNINNMLQVNPNNFQE